MNPRYFSAKPLCEKCEEAIKRRQEHVDAFIEFNAALPVESTSTWTKLCQVWKPIESDNPFKRTGTGACLILAGALLDLPPVVSEANVRLRLAEEDAKGH